MDQIRKCSYSSFFKNTRFKHIAFHYWELPYAVFKDGVVFYAISVCVKH